MSQRVQRYRDRAEVCERMAAQAKDHDAKASFDAVARQWRDLARQIEEMKFDQPPTKQTTTTALFKPNCQPGSLFISKSKFGSKVPIGVKGR